MTDLSHQWGGDLELGSTGDLRIATPNEIVTQRILRRLLTCQGEYIWQMSFGAGLGRFVGQPLDLKILRSVIVAQLLQEPDVAQDPVPEIAAMPAGTTGSGTLAIRIRYVNSLIDQKQTAHLPLRL